MILFVINLLVIFACIWPFYEDAIGTNKRKGPNRYLLVVIGYLAILAMLRSTSVGTDTASYCRSFDELVHAIDQRAYIDGMQYERGFTWFLVLLSQITSSTQVFIAVTAAIVFGAVGIYFDRHSLMPWISVLLFFTLMMYDFVLSGFRQAIAISFFLFGIMALSKKKYVWYVVFVLIAAQFHTSAYLMLLILPIALIKTNIVFFIGYVAVGCVVVAGWPLISAFFLSFNRYSYYEGSTYLTSEGFFAAFLKLAVYLLVLFFGEFLREEGAVGGIVEERARSQRLLLGQDRSYERNLELRIVCLIPLFCLLTMRAAGASRFIRYLEPVACIYLPNRLVAKTARNKQWGILLTALSFTAYDLVIQLMRTPAWQQTYPFTFFWNQ